MPSAAKTPKRVEVTLPSVEDLHRGMWDKLSTVAEEINTFATRVESVIGDSTPIIGTRR